MTHFYIFSQQMTIFHFREIWWWFMVYVYFLRPGEPFLPWHSGCVKSASVLGFIAFLRCSLVLPTRRCSLITRSAHSLSCMAGLCLPHAHSPSLSGRLGIRTPPDWGSIQTFEILSSNCLWLARSVKTVAENAAFGPPLWMIIKQWRQLWCVSSHDCFVYLTGRE